MAIYDIHSLRRHLQWAIEVEHSTLPPYLCAIYTIKEGHNPEAAEILRSIFMEEMLHMTLAANLLNAVGGKPTLDHPGFLPSYPTALPHSCGSFQIPLAKFSPETIRTLQRVEKPEAAAAPPQAERYATLGQFYLAIETSLQHLSDDLGPALFCGDPARQVGPEHLHYQGSGRVIPIQDLDSALAALREIVEQGEGLDHGSIWDGDRNMFHHTRDEVGHYFRLQQIMDGRYYRRGDTPQSGPSGESFPVDWDAVYDMQPKPRSADHAPDSTVGLAMAQFNQAYCAMLDTLQQAFNGKPELLPTSVGAMYRLREQALALMQLPAAQGTGCAGPSFGYVPPEQRAGTSSRTGRIRVTVNGPYHVEGAIPLVRKAILYSDQNESLAWQKGQTLETPASYALCRCGCSATKPFCDGSHAVNGFNGTEQADPGPTAKRQRTLNSNGPIEVKSDLGLCVHARFCFNRDGNVNQMLLDADDIGTLSQVIALVERCPSGTLTYALPNAEEAYEKVEPDLPQAIGVIANGPLWVTGGILIDRADGQPVEVRNRMTLCRCGQSKNKPFCDGSHIPAGFKD